MLNNRFENRLVRLIVDSVAEWEIDRVVFASSNANVSEFTCAREVFAVLVERDSHDAVGRVESFLDAISVVDVNVDVEDALLESEELEDAKNDVCRKAELEPREIQ
jgi:hypothetical protein